MTPEGECSSASSGAGPAVLPEPLTGEALASQLLSEGIRAQDFWAIMTALGIPLMDSAEDAETMADIVGYVGGLNGKRVADLGSGCGRFAAAMQRFGPSEVVGFELSAVLADASARLFPDIGVVRDSFTNLGASGSFDIVMALSHLLFIAPSRDAVRADLRHLRSAMPDFGLLVVEQFDMEAGKRCWGPIDGISIREECEVAVTGLLNHRFVVGSEESQLLSVCMDSLILSDEELDSVARDSGFLVCGKHTRRAPDGQLSTFWILRAQKGFNYLSDLDDFLASWLDGTHTRNTLSRNIVVDANGRVRPSGTVAWGQGASLSRNHPEFAACLEPAIAPLVLELVEGWGLVTYSSCEGHVVSDVPHRDYSEAYVGMVSFSDEHQSAVTMLIEAGLEECEFRGVTPVVRRRQLLGPRDKFDVVDVLFSRSGPEIAWDEYQFERDRLVCQLNARLMEKRTNV